MRAVLCSRLGPPDELTLGEVPCPAPGPDEVLIEVKAASINFLDALIIQGRYQAKPPLPFTPGAEVAGVVSQVGERVGHHRLGDRVVAFCGWGGFAEYTVASAAQTVNLPQDLDYEHGAAFFLTYGTALHGLQDCGRLRAGESLLVLGAAGGVGSAAIEVGKAMGARVIAAASTADKLELCRALGADDVIDYSRDSLRESLLTLTAQRGVDVVFDPVGGDYTETALRATAWQGRLLVVGFAAGEFARIPLNLALLRERSLIGVYWGEWIRRDPPQHERNVRQLLEWLSSGSLRSAITERIGLHQVPDYLARILARTVKGKVVVSI